MQICAEKKKAMIIFKNPIQCELEDNVIDQTNKFVRIGSKVEVYKIYIQGQ